MKNMQKIGLWLAFAIALVVGACSSDKEINYEEVSRQFPVEDHVILFDNANYLTSEMSDSIRSALSQQDIYAIVWATEHVVPGDINGYADSDSLKEAIYPIVKYWKENDENYDPEKLYVITYITDIGLMEVNSTSGAMNIIKFSYENLFMRAQITAQQQGLSTGIAEFAELISTAEQEYHERSWIVRQWINGANLDFLSEDGLLFQFVVPSDTFIYKYIVSWLLWIPRQISLIAISLCDSVLIGFLLLAVIVIIMNQIFVHCYASQKPSKGLGFIALLVYVVLLAAMVNVIMYVMLDLSGIEALRQYGYSTRALDILTTYNAADTIARSWVTITLCIVCIFVGFAVQPFCNAAMFLSSRDQKHLAGLNPQHFQGDADTKEAQESEFPYTELAATRTGNVLGKTCIEVAILLIVLNGTAIVYMIIFAFTLALTKLITTFGYMREFKRLGLK